MSCGRTHEVEAARDGRIADTRALVAHANGCAACRARAEELDAIAHAVRMQPIGADDELAARRARHRLVDAFDTELRAPPPRARWPFVASAAAIVAAGAVWLVAARGSSERPSALDAIAISGDGRWSRVDDGATARVTLDDGSLAIRVEHRAGAPHLVVVVPDGEIRDLGTEFEVDVRDRHVVMVSVHEGAVVLRRRDGVAILVEAGRTWRAEPIPDKTATVRPPPAPPPSPAVPTRSPAPARRVAVPPRAAPAPSPLAIDEIDRQLARAIAALDASDYATATGILRAMRIDRDDDPRAEDVAYLLVVATQRAGDPAAARDAAREYLQRFPHGFRRAAVEAIARR